MPAPEAKTEIANGNLIKFKKQVQLRFFPAGRSFRETFFIPPTVGMVLIGLFFYINSATIDVRNHSVHLPGISVQVSRKTNENT